MLPIHIVQIVLDGMPWLPLHLPEFEKLSCNWTYHIVHGAAANTGSTSWCRRQEPRLSQDGSTEFINSISSHPRVRVYQRQWWPGGKDEMCRTALATIDQQCVLLLPDVDEMFTAQQIDKIHSIFCEQSDLMRMLFYARYFLGPKIISTSRNGYGNREHFEWMRAARWDRNMTFDSHEPVVIKRNRGRCMSRDETAALGLYFEHYAWVLESQSAYKSQFYGYKNAPIYWKRLQRCERWPINDLSNYLPWVGHSATADLFSNVCPDEVNPLDKILKP